MEEAPEAWLQVVNELGTPILSQREVEERSTRLNRSPYHMALLSSFEHVASRQRTCVEVTPCSDISFQSALDDSLTKQDLINSATPDNLRRLADLQSEYDQVCAIIASASRDEDTRLEALLPVVARLSLAKRQQLTAIPTIELSNETKKIIRSFMTPQSAPPPPPSPPNQSATPMQDLLAAAADSPTFLSALSSSDGGAVPATEVSESEMSLDMPPMMQTLPMSMYDDVSPQYEVLQMWFFSHIDNPYPDHETKLWMMEETGLSMRRINNWFGNKRLRFKRSVIDATQQHYQQHE